MDSSKSYPTQQMQTSYSGNQVAFVPAQMQQYPMVQSGASAPYQDHLPYPPQPGYASQGANQTPGYPSQGTNQAPGYSSQVPQNPGLAVGYAPGYPNQPNPGQNTGYDAVYSNQMFPEVPKDDPPPYLSPADSSENIMANWDGFSDKAIRNAFIRKVYAILMLQLAFTTGIISLFVFEKRVKRFVQDNSGAYLAAYVVFLAVYFALVCCSSLRRKHPTNIILLSVFTVSLTYMAAVISSYHDTYIVIMAMGICAAVCLGITIFSCFTKFDFTSCAGVLFVLSWVLFFFGIIAIFTYRTYPIVNTVYAGLGALVFMLFLAFDTQMVMGGKKYQLSPEEYIFAALQLYLDIVYIFLFLLTILGGGKK